MSAPRLPSNDYGWYGRDVATYLEGEGFMVAGHDRRAWAALNAMVRDVEGCRYRLPRSKVEVSWVWFAESCGCTEEQHALHGQPTPEGVEEDSPADEPYRDCDWQCDHYGLPPCSDDYGWIAERTKPDASDAVPVLGVRW